MLIHVEQCRATRRDPARARHRRDSRERGGREPGTTEPVAARLRDSVQNAHKPRAGISPYSASFEASTNLLSTDIVYARSGGARPPPPRARPELWGSEKAFKRGQNVFCVHLRHGNMPLDEFPFSSTSLLRVSGRKPPASRSLPNMRHCVCKSAAFSKTARRPAWSLKPLLCFQRNKKLYCGCLGIVLSGIVSLRKTGYA